MKLAPSYISRETLIKKAAKRSQRRIAEYTSVSSAFKEGESTFVKENLDSVARYANRHNVNFRFEPNVGEADSTKMSVFRREVKFLNMYDGSEPMPYLMPEYAGEAIITSSKNAENKVVYNGKESFMEALRAEAAKILYGKK